MVVVPGILVVDLIPALRLLMDVSAYSMPNYQVPLISPPDRDH